MTSDQMSNYEDLLPEGALPVCGFRLLSFINQKGQICYQFAQTGNATAAQLIGILEMVKYDIATANSNASRAGKRSSDD